MTKEEKDLIFYIYKNSGACSLELARKAFPNETHHYVCDSCPVKKEINIWRKAKLVPCSPKLAHPAVLRLMEKNKEDFMEYLL